MTRLRFNGVETTLGDALTDSATAVTFASKLSGLAGDVPTIAAPSYIALRVGDEIVHLTAYTTGATTGTIARGREGTTAAAHSSGVAVRHVPTAADFPSVAFVEYIGGNITVNASTMADLATYSGGPGAGALDLVVPARAGDIIEASVNGLWDSTSGDGRVGYQTVVAGSAVSGVGMGLNDVNGVAGWASIVSGFRPIGGSVLYRVQAGDVSGGAVRVRPYAATTTGTRVLRGNTNNRLNLWVRNTRG
jgi:hypothetical protein